MIRTLFRWTIRLFLLLVFLLVVLFGVLQTQWAKDQLAEQLEQALAGPQQQAKLQGLTGFLPFVQRIEHFSLADEQGVWLALEEVEFSWSGRALLAGTLHIETIQAEKITLHRPPSKDTPPVEPAKRFQLPALPTHLPAIQLDHLRVNHLVLGPSLLGRAAHFQLSGQIKALTSAPGLAVTLALHSTDPQLKTQLDLQLILRTDPLTLTIDLTAEDAGLLAGLGTPAEPLRVQLHGAGALQDWQGDWQITIPGVAQWQSELNIALTDSPEIRLKGQLLALAKDIPAALKEVPLTLRVHIRQPNPQALQLAELQLLIPGASWTGQAELDFAAQTVTSTHHLQLDDLGRWDAITGVALQGKIDLDLSLSGPLARPLLRYQLQGTKLALAEMGIDQLTGQGQAQWVQEANISRLILQGKGHINRLRLAKAMPALATPIHWQYEVLAPDSGVLEVRTLQIQTGKNTLQVNGSVTPSQQTGLLEWHLRVPSLHELLPASALRGGLHLQAHTQLAANQSVTVRLKGGATALQGLPAPLLAFLGTDPHLHSRLALSAQALVVQQFALQGEAGNLSGQLRLQTSDQALSGQWQLHLPDLQALKEPPMQGQAKLVVKLAGTVSAPQIDLRLQGENLQQGRYQIDHLNLTVAQRGSLQSALGEIALQLDKAKEQLTAGLNYRLEGKRLHLSDIQLEAPATTLQGHAEIDLATQLAEGEIQANIKNLSALQSWYVPPLQGRVALHSRWQSEEGKQALEVSLQGQKIAGDFGQVAAVEITAEISDALKNWALAAKVIVQDFHHQQSRLDSATITVQGQQQQLDFAADLQGHHSQDLALQLTGQWAQQKELAHIYLQSLSGHFGDLPLALQHPVDIQSQGAALRWQKLGLTFGEASLSSSMDYSPEGLAGDLSLRVPLSLLQHFQAPPILGMALCKVALSGPLSDPQAKVEVTLQNLQWQALGKPSGPKLGGLLTAKLAKGRLQATLAASGLQAQASKADFSMPLRWSMQPFVLAMPENAALQGHLDASLDLARIMPLLALDNQHLAGQMQAQLALSGQATDPQLQGAISLQQGHYENGFTGTVLRDLNLQLALLGKRLLVKRLTANDGATGALSGKGELQFSPPGQLPFQFELTLDKATLLRQENVTATLSGALALQGDLEKASLTGVLQTDRVEVDIPEQLGPDIAELTIDEVQKNKTAASAKSSQKTVLAMDLQIKMPGKIFVRGRGLDSEWQGDLHLRGTLPDVRILGTLQAKRGHFDAVDRRFTLRQGIVDFDGANPPLPTILLEAEAKGEQILAILRLEGAVDDPKLVLDSEPTLPQDEILARLLFKRDLQAITPGQAVKLLAAINQLRGGGSSSGGILGNIRKSAGLDTLDVGGDSVETGAVKAGKYLSDKVFMEVQQGLGKGSGKVRVEVELSPSISADTELRQDSASSFGIHWKKDY